MERIKSPCGGFCLEEGGVLKWSNDGQAIVVDDIKIMKTAHYQEELNFAYWEFSSWNGYKCGMMIGQMIESIESGIPLKARIIDMSKIGEELAYYANGYDDDLPVIELPNYCYYKDPAEYENPDFDPNRDQSQSFFEFSGMFSYKDEVFVVILKCQDCYSGDLFQLKIKHIG